MDGFAGNGFFQFGLLRLYIAVFGKLFDGLQVQRRDAAGNIIQEIPVPIAYGPKEKWIRRTTEDPDMKQQMGFQYPRLSFEMNAINYSDQLQTSPVQRATNVVTAEDLFSQLKHVTYNLDFSLYVAAKNENDHFQIIEQILPFFTPDWTIRVSPVPQMAYSDECVLTFTGASYEKEYEGDLDSKRVVTWTLNFTMMVRLYGPVRHQGVIKRVMIDFLVPPGSDPITIEEVANTPRTARIQITPGLTANGQPTTNPANAIPYNQVTIEQPWAYLQRLFEYDDGKHFDPDTLQDVPV